MKTLLLNPSFQDHVSHELENKKSNIVDQQIFEFHLEDGAEANWLCFDFRCDDIAVQPTHYPICCFLLSTSGSRDFDSPLCDVFCLTGLSCFARYFAGFLHLSSSEFLARFVSNFHSLLVVPPFPRFPSCS